MKKLDALKRLKTELQELEAKIQSAEKEAAAEKAVVDALEGLLKKHDISASELIAVIYAQYPDVSPPRKQTGGAGRKRGARKAVLLKHPKRDESHEFRGGNPGWLREWKEELGKEAVKQIIIRAKAKQ